MISRGFGGRALLVLLAASTAQGYYHWVHYTPAVSGYRPIPEKFDLSALVNNTVTYVISENGPEKLADGDSWPSLVSQIHLAARTWSAVSSSRLRLAFGGFVKPGAPSVGPEIEIVFDEVPPGLVALGGPTSRSGELAGTAGGRFVPILKSTLILRKDLAAMPSWSESLFLTVAHEMGHTLGLQHALTSGAMATQRTRAVTKAAPLNDDDRAGVSVLYPTPDFATRFGSIAGRVTAGVDGMNLASVVALTADGVAVAALTNPDGSYRIDGVPAGNYYIYVHPLPPPLSGEAFPDNVTPPSEIGGTVYPSSGAFGSQFFPGVSQPDDASVVQVKAGNTLESIDFQVTRRAGIPVYAVETYSFPGAATVKPAHLSHAYARNLMVVIGNGLMADGSLAAGLTAGVIGTSAAVSGLQPWAPDPRFVQVNTQLHPIPGEGARHLVFRRDGVTHVVPAALRVMGQNAPLVTETVGVTTDDSQTLIEVRGAGFAPGARVYFDGVRAQMASFSETAIRVTPPPAASQHKAAVVVLNPDGQSSLFLTGRPQTFSYGDVPDSGISLGTTTVTPGVETFVEIAGSATGFGSGTQIAFGSADVVVRRAWVLGPERIVANVITKPGLAARKTTVVVTNGLRQWTLPDGLQIGVAPERAVSVASGIVDDATGRAGISPGFAARVQLRGVAANLTPASFTVSVSGVAAQAVSFVDSVLVFRMPAGLGPGPAIVAITAAGEALPPVLVAVDLPPPVIRGISVGTILRAAAAGEIITLHVAGLTEGRAPVEPERLQVTIDGKAAKVVQSSVTETGHDIEVALDAAQAAGSFPVVIALDGRASAAFALVVN